MATVPRPSTPLPAPPPRWRRWAIRAGIALVLLAVIAWGAFTWLFHDPFEGRLERIDLVIPSQVGVALHGSAAEILASPFLKSRVLGRADVGDLMARWEVDEALARLREEQARMNARLPGFVGGFDVLGDVFGRETVAFGVLSAGGDGPALAQGAIATRLSEKARMAFSLLKHEWARRRVEEDGGPSVTRTQNYYEIDLSSTVSDPRFAKVWAALVRDVLIVGNDRRLVSDAAHLGMTGGTGSLPGRPDAGAAFSAAGGPPLRAWVDVARWSADRAGAGLPGPGEISDSLGGIPGFLGLLVDPSVLSTAQATARFPSEDLVAFDVTGIRGDAALPFLPAALADGALRGAAPALKDAAALAPAGSCILAARIEIPPSALLQAFYGRAPADLRVEADKALKQAGTSIDAIAREFDDYFEEGASLVVERLPECDGLALDRFGPGDDGRFVLPFPGVLLALRQRGTAGPGASERLFRRLLADGKDFFTGVEDLPGLPEGVKGLRFRPRMLTGEKDLIRPAVAFDGDDVLLATNEGTLRRVLQTRAGEPSLADDGGLEDAALPLGELQAGAWIAGEGLAKYLRDQRREAATAMVEKDWPAIRVRVRAEVARDFYKDKAEIRPAELEEKVDDVIREMQKTAQTREFDQAEQEYLRRIRPVEDVGAVALSLAWDGTGFRLGIVLRAGAAK